MIKPYSPMTFIQTNKPIYNPGQTGNFTQSQGPTQLVSLLRNRTIRWEHVSMMVCSVIPETLETAPSGADQEQIRCGFTQTEYVHWHLRQHHMLQTVLLLDIIR